MDTYSMAADLTSLVHATKRYNSSFQTSQASRQLYPSLFSAISQRNLSYPLCSTPYILIFIHLLWVTEQKSFALQKNTSTDANLIMCGRKSQETNGEKGINSSQLAAAQHLMLTLKLCQKKKKHCISPWSRSFYFTCFQSLKK